jgi:hypothetical protein
MIFVNIYWYHFFGFEVSITPPQESIRKEAKNFTHLIFKFFITWTNVNSMLEDSLTTQPMKP